MIAILLFLTLFAADTFSSFSYCRDNSRGPFETQCVSLNAKGEGDVRFKRRAADSAVELKVQLTGAASDRFLSVLGATNYLEEGDRYESGKKVADLGLKKLTIDMPSGRREAVFNYSTRKEVNDLVAFFEALINQETIGFDFDNALQFERLSIPKRLDQLEAELKGNRVADPERLVPLLDRIQADTRIVNFARTRAGKLKERIQSQK